jgi:exosortase/archaeosortase family protein
MSENATTGVAQSTIARIGIPLLVATFVFFIFPVLSELYALQLREFSAFLAEIFLRITYLDVTRQGTILSLPGMTFDIIPACSGSEMLRTLLFVGILWGGVHPHIPPSRKVIATLLAGVIALLANGIRLALLLGASYMRGEVIAEGLLHTLIGLSAFAVALPGFFITTELLARRQKAAEADASPSSNLLAFTLVLTALAYLPVISACLLAWKGTEYNQFDKFGYVFFLIGAAGWFWGWRATTADHKSMRAGSLLFAGASVFAVTFTGLRTQLLRPRELPSWYRYSQLAWPTAISTLPSAACRSSSLFSSPFPRSVNSSIWF